MSSCSVEYIKRASVSPTLGAISEEEYKNLAESIHLDAMRAIVAEPYKDTLLFSDHIYLKGKKFKVLSSFDEEKKAAQKAFLLRHNSNVQTDVKSTGVFLENTSYNPVRIIPVEVYKGRPKIELIAVDILPYLEGGESLLSSSFLEDEKNLDKVYDYINDKYYKGKWINATNAYIEDLVKKEIEAPGAITDQLNDMLNRADTYISNIIKNSNRFSEFPESLQKSIKDLRGSLTKTREEFEEIENATLPYNVKQSLLATKAVERIHTITNYVFKAYKATQLMNAWIADSVQPMLNSLENADDPNYLFSVQKLGNLLQEMTYLINVFEPIESILISVEKEVDFGFWDEYNTVKIEEDVYSYFFLDKEKRERMSEYLNMGITSWDNIELRMRQMTGENKEDLFNKNDIEEVKNILEKNKILSNRPLITAFRTFKDDFSKVRDFVKKAHFEYISTILYNQQIESYGVKSIDEIPEKDRTRLLTKRDIVDELSIASADIDVLNQYLAAGDYLDDSIIRLFFDLLNSPLRLNILKNLEDRMATEEALSVSNYTLEDTDGARKKIEERITEAIYYVDPAATLEEADEEWINEKRPTLTFNHKTFKAKAGKRFKSEFNDHLAEFERKAFHHTLPSRIASILDVISFDLAAINYLDEIPAEILDDIALFVKKDFIKVQIESSTNKKFITLTTLGRSISFDQFDIKKELQKQFYRSYSKTKTPLELKNIYKERFNIDTPKQFLQELNKKSTSPFYKFMVKNSREYEFTNDVFFTKEFFEKNFGSAFDNRLLVRTKNNEFKFLNIGSIEEERFFINTEGLDIESFYIVSGELMTLQDRFKNNNFKDLESLRYDDVNGYKYYKYIYGNYKKANKRLGEYALSYNLLPKISKLEGKQFWEKLKDKTYFPDKFKQYQYVDNDTMNVNGTEIRRQEGQFVYRQVTPLFTSELEEGLEPLDDLYIMDLLFTPSARNYDTLSTVEPVAKVLRTLFTGDNTLKIDKRTAREKTRKGVVNSTLSQVFRKGELKSTKAFLKLMESKIYNYKEDKDFLYSGLSTRKIAGAVKGAVAFQFLANNVKAALTNVAIGSVENYLLGAGKRFGITEKGMKDAYKEYWANVDTLVTDDFKKNLSERSLYGQLLSAFGAIKGSKEDGRELVDPLYTQQKWINRAKYYTQSLPEHLNQSVVFIALYNSFEIAPAVRDNSGNIVKPALKLKDIVKHTPGKAFTFDKDKLNIQRQELGLEPYSEKDFDTFVISDFSAKLTRAMYEAHGMYDQLDKNLIEDELLWSFAYMFQRWLYPGFRSKWGTGGMYSPQTGEFDQEGYLRTFCKMQFKGITEVLDTVPDASAYLKIREIIKAKNLKTVAEALADTAIKASIGSVLKLSSTLFGIETPKLDKWLFGEGKEEEVINRLQRAYRFLGIWASISILLWGLKLLASAVEVDDDDNPTLTAINMLQLQAIRLNSDLSFYINPITFVDKWGLKYRDPLTIYRSTEGITGVIKQLGSFEIEDDMTINWKGNDLYKNSGPGYEKGDSKLWVKFRKQFLAPYNQYIKFANPTDEIKYMNMIFNN